MKSKILLIMLSIMLVVQTATAAPFSAKAKTKRIPAGTKFALRLMSPLTTVTNQPGAEFSAVLLTDQTADSDVILPMGSLVRGNITKIVPAKRLSKGAILYMDFDHVVTPNGRQLPLSLSVVGRTDLTYDGGIQFSKGYKQAVVENWHNTVDITKTSTEWGNETFEDFAGGYLRIITVPVAAIGGGIGGAGYYMYEGVADLIKKGKDVTIPRGEIIYVILQQPVDVPVI